MVEKTELGEVKSLALGHTAGNGWKGCEPGGQISAHAFLPTVLCYLGMWQMLSK